MIWVNAMWLISLVFSLTSALITSLNQQAVRRYIEMLKDEDKSKPSTASGDDARVRLLLFRGLKLYKMPLAILAAPALLHFSILLFFGGLVVVFHTIYVKVAIALDVAVGISGLLYMAMSLLPLLDPKCPYSTPITYISRYLWLMFLTFAKRLPGCSCLCPCACACLDSSDGAGLGEQDIHHAGSSSNPLQKAVKKQMRYLTDGFRKSVVNDATNPLEDEDRKTITWLFKQLSESPGDKSKLLVFAASIPRHKVIDLIPPIKSGKIVLRQPLLTLHRSCTDDPSAGDPGEDVRKSALLVCLTAVNHIAKASSIPDLNFVRGEFADTSRMRRLWNDSNNSIRITSRSICALVARQVLRKRRIKDADLTWLEEVTGESSNAIHEANRPIRDQMNFRSFVLGALPNYANHLSTDDDLLFKKTLAILLDVGTDNPNWQTRLFEEVGRIQQYYPESYHGVFDRLRSAVFPYLSAYRSVSAPLSHVVPSPPAPRPGTGSAPRSSQVTPSPPAPRPGTGNASRPSRVTPSPPAPRPGTGNASRPSRVTPSPQTVPSPSSFRSPTTFRSPTAFRSPTTFSSPTTFPSPPQPPSRHRPPSRRRLPSSLDAVPPPPGREVSSPNAVPHPTVPPTPHIVSPPPPRIPRHSLTARPPHAPI
jgi:hypothetical protein